MCCCAHKTATLTPIQHTVPFPNPPDLSDLSDFTNFSDLTDLSDHPDFPDHLNASDLTDFPDLPDLSDLPNFSDLTDLSDHPDFPDLLNAPDLTDPLPQTSGPHRHQRPLRPHNPVGPNVLDLMDPPPTTFWTF